MICLGANSADKSFKRNKSTQFQPRKHVTGGDNILRSSIHESLQQQTSSNVVKQSDRARRKELSCTLTLLPYNDDADDQQLLQQSIEPLSHQLSHRPLNLIRHFTGSQLLQHFPASSNRASSRSTTISLDIDDSPLPLKHNPTTETQNAFMQFDSDDDDDDVVDDDIDDNDEKRKKCEPSMICNSKMKTLNATALSSYSMSVSSSYDAGSTENSNFFRLSDSSFQDDSFTNPGVFYRGIYGGDSNQFSSGQRNYQDGDTHWNNYTNRIDSFNGATLEQGERTNEIKGCESLSKKRKQSTVAGDDLQDTPPPRQGVRELIRNDRTESMNNGDGNKSNYGRPNRGIDCISDVNDPSSNNSADGNWSRNRDDNETENREIDEPMNDWKDGAECKGAGAANASDTSHITVYKCDFSFALNGSESKHRVCRSTLEIESGKHKENALLDDEINGNSLYCFFSYNGCDDSATSLRKKEQSKEVVSLNGTPLEQTNLNHPLSLSIATSTSTSIFTSSSSSASTSSYTSSSSSSSSSSSLYHFHDKSSTWMCQACTLENPHVEDCCSACGALQSPGSDKLIGHNHKIKNGNNNSYNNSNDNHNNDSHSNHNNGSNNKNRKNYMVKEIIKVSEIVMKKKTETEKARTLWICSWCKRENGMRRRKCELCEQARVTKDSCRDEECNIGNNDNENDADNNSIYNCESKNNSNAIYNSNNYNNNNNNNNNNYNNNNHDDNHSDNTNQIGRAHV